MAGIQRPEVAANDKKMMLTGVLTLRCQHLISGTCEYVTWQRRTKITDGTKAANQFIREYRGKPSVIMNILKSGRGSQREM